MEKIFDEIFSKYKYNYCLKTEVENVTYGDLYEIINRYHESLPSFRIAILLFEQDINCVAFYIYCLINKIPLILLEPNTFEDEVFSIAKEFGVSVIATCRGGIKDSKCLTISSKFFIYLSDIIEVENIAEDLALLISTSGSLHGSKFVKLSYSNLICNTMQILDYLPISETSLAAPPPILSYVYGLSVLNTHLFKGGCVALSKNNILDKKYWDFIVNIKPTNFNGVPYFFELFKKLDGFKKLANKPLFITQAGGKISQEISDYLFLEMQNKNVYIMYGQTEATARMAYLHPTKYFKKKGSVGLAVNGGRFTIIDNEIVYEGNNIFKGYAKCKDDLNHLSDVRFLHTGDVGYIDEDGYLFIIGRKNRFCKVAGKRISLDLCEFRLKEAGIDNAIININETIIVFIVEKVDEKLIFDKLKLFITKYKLKIIERFPRTKNGKINYGELVRLV